MEHHLRVFWECNCLNPTLELLTRVQKSMLLLLILMLIKVHTALRTHTHICSYLFPLDICIDAQGFLITWDNVYLWVQVSAQHLRRIVLMYKFLSLLLGRIFGAENLHMLALCLYLTYSVTFNNHRISEGQDFISPFVKLASNWNNMNLALSWFYIRIETSNAWFCDANFTVILPDQQPMYTRVKLHYF